MLGELTENEMVEVLENNIVGRIGCTDGKRVYIVPVSYLYRGDHLLCHARDGLKISMMRTHPEVCFEVDEIRDFTHWKSVVAHGTFQEITDGDALAEARTHFSEVMLNMKASQTALPPEAEHDSRRVQKPASVPTIFYRVLLQEVTGRFEHSYQP